jgi:hypothetical protein
VAFLLDEAGGVQARVNPEIVEVVGITTPQQESLLKSLLEAHVSTTSSEKAKALLADWTNAKSSFKLLVPPSERAAMGLEAREVGGRLRPLFAMPWFIKQETFTDAMTSLSLRSVAFIAMTTAVGLKLSGAQGLPWPAVSLWMINTSQVGEVYWSSRLKASKQQKHLSLPIQ